MCGIVGYTGRHEAEPILLAGLRRLEYRGYDSAGLATVDDGRLTVRKRAGRVRMLEELLRRRPARRPCGISHTRWATHGPADRRQRPPPRRRSTAAVVAVVHNGVIENHAALRRELEARGFDFPSQTDTEVIAHLIAPRTGTASATCSRPCCGSCPRLEGTYGLAVVSPRTARARSSGRGWAARWSSASATTSTCWPATPSAIAPHTRRVAYLQDGEVVRLTPDRLRDPAPRARADHPADRPDRLEARRRRAGRLRPLHAEGDPRAARHGPRRLPGPAPPRRGHRAVRRA